MNSVDFIRGLSKRPQTNYDYDYRLVVVGKLDLHLRLKILLIKQVLIYQFRHLIEYIYKHGVFLNNGLIVFDNVSLTLTRIKWWKVVRSDSISTNQSFALIREDYKKNWLELDFTLNGTLLVLDNWIITLVFTLYFFKPNLQFVNC